MRDEGAGHIGPCSFCPFSAAGEGRHFDETTHPAIGEPGRLETVNEMRIEALCEREKLEMVLAAVQKVHPHEEIAVDVHPVEFRRLTKKHH